MRRLRHKNYPFPRHSKRTANHSGLSSTYRIANACCTPVHVASGVMAGSLSAATTPLYPSDAKEKKLEGTVQLRAIIDADGNITDLRVIHASDPIFSNAAIAAVSRWHYRPFLLNGVPTSVETTINVNFTMGKK